MNAMILVAGRGERLRPVTDSMPKTLVEVRGEKLLSRHLGMLARAGAETVVINLGWLGEQIVAYVGSGKQFGVNVVFSPEYDDILETGGGICRALPILGAEPFWVVNGDVFTDIELPDKPLDVNVDGHLILVPTPAHKEKGDFDLCEKLVQFGADPQWTYSGISLYRPEFFAGIESGRFPLGPLLFDAAKRSKLSGNVYTGVWEDVGTPARLAELNRSSQ